VGVFKIAAVLVDGRGAGLSGRVFTGCVDIAGRASWSAVPLVVSHVNTALVVGFADAGSSEALGTGMLAAWSSAILSVEAVLAIPDVMGAKSLAAVSTGCVDGMGGAICLATLSASHVTAALVAESLGGAGSLGAGSSGILGNLIGLLAGWSSVVFSVHVEAPSAIAAVLALPGLSACSVARPGLSIDLYAACRLSSEVSSRGLRPGISDLS
jgi:hypothetical protein